MRTKRITALMTSVIILKSDSVMNIALGLTTKLQKNNFTSLIIKEIVPYLLNDRYDKIAMIHEKM